MGFFTTITYRIDNSSLIKGLCLYYVIILDVKIENIPILLITIYGPNNGTSPTLIALIGGLYSF